MRKIQTGAICLEQSKKRRGSPQLFETSIDVFIIFSEEGKIPINYSLHSEFFFFFFSC